MMKRKEGGREKERKHWAVANAIITEDIIGATCEFWRMRKRKKNNNNTSDAALIT